MIKLDINIGDTILTGKFRNKKVIVKDIGIDKFGSPTVNGKPILQIRIPKLYHKERKESTMKLKNLIREDFEGNLGNVSGHNNKGTFIIKNNGNFKFDVDGIGKLEGNLKNYTDAKIKNYFEMTYRSFKILKKELDRY